MRVKYARPSLCAARSPGEMRDERRESQVCRARELGEEAASPVHMYTATVPEHTQHITGRDLGMYAGVGWFVYIPEAPCT